jgi:hypothetical protein
VVFAIACLFQRRKRTLWAAAILVVGLSNILMCICSIPLAFKDFEERNSIHFVGHLYRLVGEWAHGVGGDHDNAFVLYECDSLGLLCRRVFVKTYLEALDYNEDEFREVSTTLLPDESANSLTVVVDDKIFYTYQPPENH